MKMVGSLKITTPSDREIAMTRVFDAPRHLVDEAYTRPELLQRWLGVHNGWVLAVCEIDLRVGGACRWVWRGPGGEEMGMGGKTTLTMTVRYATKAARDAVLESPMEQGVAAGFDVLEGILAESA